MILILCESEETILCVLETFIFQHRKTQRLYYSVYECAGLATLTICGHFRGKNGKKDWANLKKAEGEMHRMAQDRRE